MALLSLSNENDSNFNKRRTRIPWHENIGLKGLSFINLDFFLSKVFEKVVIFKKFLIFVNWLFKSSSPLNHRKLMHP